jgi:pimeloyl-ACP methyl ester carboxylesterase
MASCRMKFNAFRRVHSGTTRRVLFPVPSSNAGAQFSMTRRAERSLSDQDLTIHVLGEFRVLKGRADQDLPKSRKTRALLAYLILSGRRHRRERLCDLFWDIPDDPRGSLRWSLSRLRSLVEDHARDLVDVDPYSVSAHATLIRVLSTSGRREEADRQQEISLKELSDSGAQELKALTEALGAKGSDASSPIQTPGPRLEQEIRFCTTSDKVRIAYASVGDGPPLIKTANWLNHLEYDWDSPVWRHVFRGLAADRRLIRYDERANGLSDWDVDDISFDAFVRDLESVVEASGVERFPLLGISQGCAISIEYVLRNPGRVTHLILHGGYARGWRIGADLAEIARREALQTLILHGWGQDNPAFRQVFTSRFIPDGNPEHIRWMNELMRVTTPPENAVRIQENLSRVDVRDQLSKVNVPTLVIHSRNDGCIPYQRGLELAAGIPGARLVTLESNNHLLLEHEAEFPRYMKAIRAFLNETH